jgi:NAD(P)H-hydrate epimerase
LRSGAGLVSVHAPQCGYETLQTAVPEAMVVSDTENDFISDSIRVEQFNAIGIGPGIGTEKQTQNILKLLIQNTKVPLVLDADALNIISENKTWLAFIPANSILTPHPKEFERLAGKSENSFERLKIQREFSIKNKVYVVLKGAHTAISCPNGNFYFNSTGNPGMATGGSGDVLTGIITSLLAQGYTSQQASIMGVYLHGLAGDIAAQEKTEESMIASDIIECLPEAFHFLKI